ncbi:MAG: hypothetical protein LBN23_01070, partial [Paludibacter sp.]|nr:hypothetical protein [Paludibacter sp.]
MKRITLTLVVLAVCLCAKAQYGDENPFSRYGFDKKIMYTMSKGEFSEFHDRSDVVEIGSVLFDTRTNQVVGFISEEKDSAEVSAVTSAMSIDPLCEKYYWISPYAYCLNNPVKYVDPDGRSTRVAMNEDGTYNVIGGDLNDNDYNIYVYSKDKDGNYTVRGSSIGVTTSITSFYNDSKKDDGSVYGWMGTINTQDNSGELFLSNNIFGNTMTLDEYMANASLTEKYDFKSIGAGSKTGEAYETHVYRGTKIGTKDG